MSTTSVDQTKNPAHAIPNPSSCCGGHGKPEAAGNAHAHGSCAAHEGKPAPVTTVAPADDQAPSASSAGRHPEPSSCCSGD